MKILGGGAAAPLAPPPQVTALMLGWYCLELSGRDHVTEEALNLHFQVETRSPQSRVSELTIHKKKSLFVSYISLL